MAHEEKKFKSGYVAIVGEPNVGKSTLMNAFLQQKISIVTPKPQTTRRNILGILSGEDHQIIFLDTPGILKPKYLLHEVMVEFADMAIHDADIILLMIEANHPKIDHDSEHGLIFNRLKRLKKPVFLLINKIDRVHKNMLLPIIEYYRKLLLFREIFPISALTLDGVAELKNSLIQSLSEHPPFYPSDIVSDHPERFFVGEIIREKIFQKYRDEIPYSTEVEILEFKEREKGKDFISAEISVERESQKGIIIGKGGKALKELGETARADVEQFLGLPVFLELYVKVREKWREREEWLKRFGYKVK